MLVTYAQTDHIYLTWRWSDGGAPEAGRLHPAALTALPTLLTQALPDAQPGETTEAAIDRARSGPLGSPDGTDEFGAQLADALLPGDVVMALLARAAADGARPRVRIQACPALAQVPWPLLRVRLSADGTRRTLLSDIADVCGGIPAGAVQAAGPTAGDSVVAVIDPRVPGHTADSPLGSVLGRPRDDDPLAALLGPQVVPPVTSWSQLVRRRDLDREWLRSACQSARRLMYVGHVSSAGLEDATGEESSLHLTCVDGAGRHRPLLAREVAGDDWWRMPERVALIGCGSGTDLRYPEPMGWTIACAMRGARLVTSTLWTLPTDATFVGLPLRSLVLAVDAAHESPDPVSALGAWQREQHLAWQQTGDDAHSPLVWASAVTYLVEG